MKLIQLLRIPVAAGAALFLMHGTAHAAIFNPGTGHWYELVSSGAGGEWDTAETAAIGLGGHLVTINDSTEEDWLRSNFGSSTRYWIGYNDVASEGSYVWSSGEAPGYSNWDGGEPNNASPPLEGEDYAVLNWNSTTGGWNDWSHARPDYYNISGIAEYATPTPEASSTLVLLTMAAAGLGVLRRRTRS